MTLSPWTTMGMFRSLRNPIDPAAAVAGIAPRAARASSPRHAFLRARRWRYMVGSLPKDLPHPDSQDGCAPNELLGALTLGERGLAWNLRIRFASRREARKKAGIQHYHIPAVSFMRAPFP